jgi:HSP20 family protein
MFGYLTTFDNDLFERFRDLQQQIDQMHGTSPALASIRAVARGSYPPINVGITPGEVDIFVFAAGLDPDKLDVSIQQNVLSIAGERAVKEETEGNYYLRERFDGSFRRVVTLPDDVDVDKFDATYRDGVLSIRVQRREAVKPRQIKIN